MRRPARLTWRQAVTDTRLRRAAQIPEEARTHGVSDADLRKLAHRIQKFSSGSAPLVVRTESLATVGGPCYRCLGGWERRRLMRSSIPIHWQDVSGLTARERDLGAQIFPNADLRDVVLVDVVIGEERLPDIIHGIVQRRHRGTG